MNHYYLGDVNKQAELLKAQINSVLTLSATQKSAMIAGAVAKMFNRVNRHYGLNNKYDGKGNLRK